MSYAVAYANSKGIGFSDTEPWVDIDINSLNELKMRVENLKLQGYKRVIPFQYDEEENIEEMNEGFTWDFVENNKVE
jgi:hypothetical protein